MAIFKAAGTAALTLLGAEASLGQAAFRIISVSVAIACAISAVSTLARSNACQDAEYDLLRPKGGALPAAGGAFDADQARVTGICLADGH